jgi:hypothetical protein
LGGEVDFFHFFWLCIKFCKMVEDDIKHSLKFLFYFSNNVDINFKI